MLLRRVSLVMSCHFLSFLGCSDSVDGRYGVSGEVSYQGEAIPSGVITFIREGAMASAGGAAISDGKYSVPAEAGLPEGDYRVAISVPEGGPVVEEEAPGISVEPVETLPPRYNADTELRAKVQAGSSNQFNFNLE
jgi:hypothetical protein